MPVTSTYIPLASRIHLQGLMRNGVRLGVQEERELEGALHTVLLVLIDPILEITVHPLPFPEALNGKEVENISSHI